jgi:hypothetical protein
MPFARAESFIDNAIVSELDQIIGRVRCGRRCEETMAAFTKDELIALGQKLDAAGLTAREREILGAIIDAATGGESGGFGDELSDAQLAGVAGGADSLSTKIKEIKLPKPWGPGQVGSPDNPQYTDSPWSNAAVVKW